MSNTAAPLINITIPITLPPRGNFRGSTRNRKHIRLIREQREVTRMLVHARAARRPTLPCIVRLTRIAPCLLDVDDNLPISMKSPRDGIADWLGLDDRSDQIKWLYDQRKSPVPKLHQMQIEIFEDVEPLGCKLCGAGAGLIPCPHGENTNA